MILITIAIVLFSLIALTALHELGHFLLARKFGVKVEEFGIGYPPKIWGKKFGETLYSLNLLPFGAFVRILGDEDASDNEQSFSKKPVWQRALILLGGVVSFWLVAFLIFAFIIGVGGVPTAITDDFSQTGVNTYVQIYQVSPDSPAFTAGLKAGDTIVRLRVADYELQTYKTAEVQDFIAGHKGEEITVYLRRGQQNLEITAMPRVNPPQGEGAMGVALVRVADLKYAWYQAPVQAAKLTAQQTVAIPAATVKAVKEKINGSKDSGLQFVGPIGMGQIMGQAMNQGWGNYLTLIAMISIWMALFNVLPVPALDGGRLLFLAIELIKRKPVDHKLEQRITATFFFLMIALMAVVSIKDIIRLF
ncbi:MAG: M50 family metallopeptidase [Candidatus Pacebacteria bacterium]|nr:M50 family metallopeptidase [Candidatus Paceibacterota bacterium]